MLWSIHCLDKPDSTDLRQATRPAHIEYLSQFEIVAGGPLVGDDGNMCGSLIMLEAADKAAAQAFADGDPYATAGLFDQVTIREFMKVKWPGEG